MDLQSQQGWNSQLLLLADPWSKLAVGSLPEKKYAVRLNFRWLLPGGAPCLSLSSPNFGGHSPRSTLKSLQNLGANAKTLARGVVSAGDSFLMSHSAEAFYHLTPFGTRGLNALQ